MAAIYHIRIKKEYAAAVIEDLQKMDAVELIPDIEDYPVPEWQMAIVRERMINYKANPDQALDFDSAMDDIEKDL